MAIAAASSAAQTIGKLLVEEGMFLAGVRDRAEDLQRDLKRMEAFLRAADSIPNEDDRIREWVFQTRDLAYEAEDLIEAYASEQESRRKRGFSGVLKRCLCILSEGYTLHQIGSQIDSLRSRISDLAKSFKDFGIIEAKQVAANQSYSYQSQGLIRTYSSIIEKDLVAVESQVEILVQNLQSESHQAVCIYGMGGSGKTTLARQVYHHPDIRRNFNAFVWVCISQQWQERDLLENIFARLFPELKETAKQQRDDELVRQIYKFQHDHKCLVVLDDIWSIEAWECIKHAFSLSQKGSKLLLTTRKEDVARHRQFGGFLHKQQLLSDKDSWELLQKNVAADRFAKDNNELQEMKELGKEMVKHCGGLPIAVLALGGILASNGSLQEWERIHRNIKSDGMVKGNCDRDRMLNNVLALSYNDLPYHLKPCFLYLSRYPEDAKINAERLYHIWMAEGMIASHDQTREETMMEVAEKYLGELAKRCLVSVRRNKEGSSMLMFESCQMHDVMRELCLDKAREENFIQVVDGDRLNCFEVVGSSVSSQRSTRVAITFQNENIGNAFPFANVEEDKAKHLRSLIVSTKTFSIGTSAFLNGLELEKFQKLRSLVIEGVRLEPSDTWCIPSSIGRLIHLRNLTLYVLGDVNLPSSIGDLKCLETLIVSLNKLPNVLWKLKQLKHLSGLLTGCRLDGLNNLEMLEGFDTSACDVKDLASLTNLRSLDVRAVAKLEDLEELIHIVKFNLTKLKFLCLGISSCDFLTNNGSNKLIARLRKPFLEKPLQVRVRRYQT